MDTQNLGLHLMPSSEYASKKYYEYIDEMSGDTETSNMNLIDSAIYNLRVVLSDLETQLESI